MSETLPPKSDAEPEETTDSVNRDDLAQTPQSERDQPFQKSMLEVLEERGHDMGIVRDLINEAAGQDIEDGLYYLELYGSNLDKPEWVDHVRAQLQKDLEEARNTLMRVTELMQGEEKDSIQAVFVKMDAEESVRNYTFRLQLLDVLTRSKPSPADARVS